MPTEEQTYRKSIEDKLELILQQTTRTNGRVTILERNMLISGTAIIVIFLLKVPELAPLLLKLIV